MLSEMLTLNESAEKWKGVSEPPLTTDNVIVLPASTRTTARSAPLTSPPSYSCAAVKPLGVCGTGFT